MQKSRDKDVFLTGTQRQVRVELPEGLICSLLFSEPLKGEHPYGAVVEILVQRHYARLGHGRMLSSAT